ncbi:1-deoxy-D-xylulose-5-phosphate synthase [bacterium]|nr:1-deoxy-D-xylulose-5-phosphate synthase [bacterium]
MRDYSELNSLNKQQTKQLCADIREVLISTISKNGGHLSSNLGVVELTVAMLKCFHPPQDDIIFDVGHQSYTYKLLTGRWEAFSTLRQENGISGYPDPKESEFDSFISGHSSTALSVAFGFALTKKLSGDPSYTVALVGDGSLTGGEAFEALNNIGHYQLNVLAILNDNEMSISRNVGSLSLSLSKLRSSLFYRSLKLKYRSRLQKIGFPGKLLVQFWDFIRQLIKKIFSIKVIFEELGFSYLGPIDGHDIDEMVDMIQRTKNFKKPVLLHIITKKGKGYECVENDPTKFHSSPPFLIEGNHFTTMPKQPSYSETAGLAVLKMMTLHKKVIFLTAAMGEGLGMAAVASSFPDRFFDLGIAEQHLTSSGAAIAKKGFIPIIGIYSTFLQRAYDQIIHDCCLLNLKVIFLIDRAGAVSDDGPTHQGSFDIASLLPVPNTTILSPSSASEFEKMIQWAVESAVGPTFIRYPKAPSQAHRYQDKIEFGKSHLIEEKPGTHLLFLGPFFETVKKVQELLLPKGIEIGLSDARFAKPLDESFLVNIAHNHSLLVTLEDGVVTGGFGQYIQSFLQEKELTDCHIMTLGIRQPLLKQMKRERLLEVNHLSAEKIAGTILEYWHKKI